MTGLTSSSTCPSVGTPPPTGVAETQRFRTSPFAFRSAGSRGDEIGAGVTNIGIETFSPTPRTPVVLTVDSMTQLSAAEERPASTLNADGTFPELSKENIEVFCVPGTTKYFGSSGVVVA